ncbi:acid protease [Sporormia fimetaria CBS 119925]|uniref:Acid protease n=1 Tax=Sporormia fimetaria CBS 119925 TaxID=1340428 RepID=A0A6A6V392_9PLEO|nr:acid protease [Sporormia fimetaria CBS 119925]
MSEANLPAPIVFAPSERWDGHDGSWSTFDIHVGSPPQSFRVLPSPATGDIYIPHPQGCENSTGDCGQRRGVYGIDTVDSKSGFQPNASTTWHEMGWYDTLLREDLNYTGNGLYGQDTVGLQLPSLNGPVLEQQIVAAVANKKVFIGVFGLSPVPANFSDFNNPQPVFFKVLKDQNKIPSLSYAYTAGASYKTPQSFASLTLGGYVTSRFTPNKGNITYPFDPDDERPLSVSIQSITTNTSFNGVRSLLPEPIYINLDFTVPHFWLPGPVCDNFASVFGLSYDNTTSLYLINSTTHAELLKRNPSINFGLGNTPNPDERVNIVLPYAAFDLEASWPWYENVTRYFPIRRAENKSQYTLGRTFLQEAYLIADYERGNFSLHQARFPASTEKRQIVSIASPVEESSVSSPPSSVTTPPPKRLNGGMIAGIAMGVVVFIVLCIGAAVWAMRRRRERSRRARADAHDVALGQDRKAAEASGDEVHELKSPLGEEIAGEVKCELGSECAYELPSTPQNYELDGTERRT